MEAVYCAVTRYIRCATVNAAQGPPQFSPPQSVIVLPVIMWRAGAFVLMSCEHTMFPTTRCSSHFVLRGCKNRAHSVSWLDVVKGVTNQGVECFVMAVCFFCVYSVCNILFPCFK